MTFNGGSIRCCPVQAHHDEQIQALIRVAESQQSNLDHLDDTVAEMAQTVAGVGQSVAILSQTVGALGQSVGKLDQSVERSRIEMLERQKYLDERVDRLVSAIGELAHKRQ